MIARVAGHTCLGGLRDTMHRSLWHKKDVMLTWNGRRTTFVVAQELFSSHEVDAGSRLLLRSLDLGSLPAHGHATDYGCGYGVLGLALREAMPGWTVDLVDRDALAVAFSQWNAERLRFSDGSVTAGIGLGVDMAPPSGCDLVLWNVPGKAGEPVIAALTADVGAALAEGGLAALVVVNPLAETVRAAIAADASLAVTLDEAHADHTVIHARRSGGPVAQGDPFDRGVFDREPAGFGVDDFDYDITPVIGIPEYDTFGYATENVFDMLRTVEGAIGSLLVLRPGQGHVPLVAANALRPGRVTLLDRDQLALRATARAFIDAGVRAERLEAIAGVDIVDVADARFDLAILMLEDQVRNEVHIARLNDLAGTLMPGGQLVVGGTSSVVSRFLGLAAKQRAWKARDRTKRSGASAARLHWTG